jgi:hypothetical protein
VHGIGATHVVVEPLAPRHLAAAMLLLNMREGFMKMRSFGITDACGMLRLTQVPFWDQEAGYWLALLK